MRRKALALGVALALILASLPVLLVLNSNKPSGAVEMSLPLPELTITVNGRTVYAGPDPPTNNMIQWLSVAIGSSLSATVVDTSGYTLGVTSPSGGGCCVSSNYRGLLKINLFPESYFVVLGNGLQSFSRSVYKLASQYAKVGVGTDIGYNATHAWLDVVASYQFPSKNTITEVGLLACFTQLLDVPTIHSYDVLLLYTSIPPVTVNQGDLVVVRYRFYFTKPFTIQMAKYLSLWVFPSGYRMKISASMNHTSGTSTFFTSVSYSYFCLDRYSIPYFYLSDIRSQSPQVYLAYGNGNQPWSIWDRDVYSPLGRAPLETVTASDNAVQMVFYINNPGSTNMHITELALQVNTTDASGVWRLVTLARWTVDYTIQAGSGVHIAVRVATP